MELRIGGNEVLLSLSKTFVTEDDAALVLQVSKYKPLADYLTKWKPADGNISTMTIVSVDTIASRIASAVVDVALVNPRTKERWVQRVRLSDESRVVVLPVAKVDGADRAILVERARASAGGLTTLEALEGSFAKDGSLSGAAAALFSSIGWPITEKVCTALSIEEIALGAEQTTVRVLQATKVFSADGLRDALAKGVAPEGDARLVAVDLDQVGTTSTDMKASVAAALALLPKN